MFVPNLSSIHQNYIKIRFTWGIKSGLKIYTQIIAWKCCCFGINKASKQSFSNLNKCGTKLDKHKFFYEIAAWVFMFSRNNYIEIAKGKNTVYSIT